MTDDTKKTFGFETRAVHAGTPPDPMTGARNMPIYQTTSFVFDDVEQAAELFNLQTFGYIYSRLTNPTVAALEERVSSLESGRAATACASGHAAQILALFPILEAGDEFVASMHLYGGSVTQFTHTFKRFDWRGILVDARDPQAVEDAVTPKTKAIFAESLSNPGGVLVDIEALAEIANRHGIPLIIDNTMASPWLCRPFDWGADIVIHSLTKFLGGHGSAMGGVVVESGKFDWGQNDKFQSMTTPDPAYHGLTFYETFGDFSYSMKNHAVGLRDLGATLAPNNAFLILQGIETLPLRMERHVANVKVVAEFLDSHPAVAWVSWAGLPSNPQHELAKKYLPKGVGPVFTFGMKGGYKAGVRLVEACNLLSHLANVGDTRSLILHPASTTHRQLSEEQQIASGAGPDVVRISVGIETVDDIIADLDQALEKAAAGPCAAAAE